MIKRLPIAHTERKPLFAGRVDYVVLDDHRGVVLPAAALSLVDKAFVDRAFATVPKRHRVVFTLGNNVLVGCPSQELCEAVIDLWNSPRLPKAQRKIASDMVHEMITTITGSRKARDTVNSIFGEELFR